MKCFAQIVNSVSCCSRAQVTIPFSHFNGTMAHEFGYDNQRNAVHRKPRCESMPQAMKYNQILSPCSRRIESARLDSIRESRRALSNQSTFSPRKNQPTGDTCHTGYKNGLGGLRQPDNPTPGLSVYFHNSGVQMDVTATQCPHLAQSTSCHKRERSHIMPSRGMFTQFMQQIGRLFTGKKTLASVVYLDFSNAISRRRKTVQPPCGRLAEDMTQESQCMGNRLRTEALAKHAIGQILDISWRDYRKRPVSKNGEEMCGNHTFNGLGGLQCRQVPTGIFVPSHSERKNLFAWERLTLPSTLDVLISQIMSHRSRIPFTAPSCLLPKAFSQQLHHEIVTNIRLAFIPSARAFDRINTREPCFNGIFRHRFFYLISNPTRVFCPISTFERFFKRHEPIRVTSNNSELYFIQLYSYYFLSFQNCHGDNPHCPAVQKH